jgi:hypothetical protein
MGYSFSELSEIEDYYSIELPIVYKRMMMLIGHKILTNIPNQKTYYRTIYKVQEKMTLLTKDGENEITHGYTDEKGITHGVEKAFFVTNCLTHHDNIEHSKTYFIEPTGHRDCPVYAWIYDGYSGESSIYKISNGIEEWLSEVSCRLSLELQINKIFNKSPFLKSGD